MLVGLLRSRRFHSVAQATKSSTRPVVSRICPSPAAGEVGFGGDVSEPDGGEHGDGEIRGTDLVHRLGEAVGLVHRDHVVGGSENAEQQGDSDDMASTACTRGTVS